MIGKTVAHYKIVEKIGAGGMGEVWRAADSKLGRDVALKVLPEAFAQDSERMARFSREAQVLASLNHPNIAAIYGFEQADSTRALVLELVEGPTLAERIDAGAVPLDEALGITHQIAEAVESAHESGVVHRDLKPANVKLSPDGRVKVLDFGLAKALEDPMTSSTSGSVEASPTLSPTLSSPITGALTGANVILGTAAYMSPEQARGQTVDKRSDIWAFGVILYEMLTGKRLFYGETVSDTLAAVLRKDPNWDALPENTPPRIRRLLRRCLERKPKDRLRDIGDARLAIAEVVSGQAEEEEPSLVGAAPVAVARSRRPWMLPAVAVAAAAVTFAITSLDRPVPDARPVRKYAMPLPAGTHAGAMALAPDGSALAYRLDGVLSVRELTTGEERELDPESGAGPPFWSPDGEWIAYGSGSGLWKVRRSGGQPIRIATAPNTEGFGGFGSGAWLEDGRILFTNGWTGVNEVSSQGGEPVELVALGEGESDFHEMASLEDRAIAIIVHGADGIDAIDLVEPDGTRQQIVHYPGETLQHLAWSPTGHLLFGRSGDAAGLWAIPISLSAMEVTGTAFLVAPGGAHASVSEDGTLGYLSGSAQLDTVIGLVNRQGGVVEEIGEPADHHPFPSLSPDGRLVACRIREGETENLWFTDVERGSRRRFTQGPGDHAWGSWDATGRDFWYFDQQWTEAHPPEIYVTAANGTGEPRVVAAGHLPKTSPDGRWLLFTKLVFDSGDLDMDLWLLDLAREGAEPQPFVEEPGRQWPTDISPTAPLVAYVTRTSGDWEVHLTTYPERTGDWPVSTRGGWWPQWRGDGQELYYAVGDSIMAVDVDSEDGSTAPRLSRPRLLFRRPRYDPLGGVGGVPDGFEVMPDGEHFVLMLTIEDEDASPPALVVVQNWAEEFRSR